MSVADCDISNAGIHIYSHRKPQTIFMCKYVRNKHVASLKQMKELYDELIVLKHINSVFL